jgi:zinc protease
VDEASRLGASISAVASSGAETATVEGSGLSSHATQWTELLTSVVLHPTFPADEFAQVRQRKMVEARMRRTFPNVMAADAAQRILYGSHPAASSGPSPDDLAALKLDSLPAWHRERYTPGKTVISCSGRVRPSAFVAQMEKLLGGWKGADPNVTPPPNPQPQLVRRIILLDRPGAAQTELVIGNLTFDRRDPDWFPMSIVNAVFGNNPGSRLSRILRNEKGYVFTVQSLFGASRFTGAWQVRAGTRTDATGDTVAIILDQLRRLSAEPISGDELDAAKRNVVGSFALSLERPAYVLNNSYLRYRYGFSLDYWERYAPKMMAVTAAEAQAVAQKYMDPEKALIVAVGDASKIRGALEKFGKVE